MDRRDQARRRSALSSHLQHCCLRRTISSLGLLCPPGTKWTRGRRSSSSEAWRCAFSVYLQHCLFIYLFLIIFLVCAVNTNKLQHCVASAYSVHYYTKVQRFFFFFIYFSEKDVFWRFNFWEVSSSSKSSNVYYFFYFSHLYNEHETVTKKLQITN